MRKLLHYGAAAAVALAFVFTPGPVRADAVIKPHVAVIRYLGNHGYAAPYEFAGALGWLKKKGIEIKFAGFSQGGPENIMALITSSTDLADCSTPCLVNAIAAGSPFLAVSAVVGEDKETNSKFFVLADNPIKTAKDLSGKTIAINTLGSHLDFVVREYLKQHHMKISNVQLVVVPGPQLNQVLRHKQADVVATGAAWQTTFEGQIEAEGGVRVLFTDYQVLGPLVVGSSAMRKSFIEQHPQVVRDFVTETAKAVDWTNQHPAQARRLLAKIFKERGDNPALAKYWTGFGLRQHNLYTDRDAQFWIDALVNAGKLKPGQLTPADVETNKYNAFAQLAQHAQN